MAKPQDRFLRFGCPRCLAKLKAPPSKGGTRQRCPRCYFLLDVPDTDQLAALGRRDEYTLYEGDGAPEAAQPAIVVECPICHTRIDASEDQIGQEVNCPDCDTAVLVSPRPARKEEQAPPPAAPKEQYALLDDEGPRAEDSSRAHQRHLPVYCPLCNTLMQVTEDQVGQTLVCPDCQTPVPVLPRQEAPPKPSHPVYEEYALREEPAQPAPTSEPVPTPQPAPTSRPVEPVLIAVVCQLCETRMHASLDQVGELITCPDCGTPAVVPRPEASAPKPAASQPGVGEYGIGEPAERPEPQRLAGARTVRIEPDDTDLLGRSQTPGVVPARPAPPRRPMVSGILNFPFYPGTWPRLAGLALGLIVGLPPLILAGSLIQVPKGGPATAVPWTAAMILLTTGSLYCIGWALVASPLLLAILGDTAEGADEVQDWPEKGMFLDWAQDSLYLVNSVLVSFLPGVVLAQALASAGLPYWFCAPASLFFVLPIVLLSMLEAGSPWSPLSLSVCRSLFSAFGAWVLFYLEAALLSAGLLLFAEVVLYLVGVWGLLLIAPAGVMVLIVYFRLLGRLAWCCTRASAVEKGERKQEEDEEDRNDLPARSRVTSTDASAGAPDAVSEPSSTGACAGPEPQVTEPSFSELSAGFEEKDGKPSSSETSAGAEDEVKKPGPSILDDDFDRS